VTEVQLGAAIAKLEDEFQVVYRMHAIDSLSYKEISLRLGIPVNTVGTRISRARGKLRTLLEASIRDGGST
jgi:RNA polymerase sigma-70 factor (ECF subfamily)